MLRFFLTIVALLVTSNVNAQPQATHDRAFWRAVIAQKYQVPEGQAAAPLALELAGYVASVDPELRDNFGYEILATWIHRSAKLSAGDLDALRKSFLPFVLTGIGESSNDNVFARSFALLNLKELAAADLKMPYLTQATFDELFELAARAFSTERDLRGFVPEKGWAHATAHGADLLRILARNDKLSVTQQSRLVTVIATRTREAGIVFTWGEDARLAAALASVIGRKDFDITAFDNWVAALRTEHQKLWEGSFEPSKYVRVRAQVNTLAQLAALLARQATGPEKLRAALNTTLAAVN